MKGMQTRVILWSSPEHPLDHEAWCAIEEEGEECSETEEQQRLEDRPAVLVPDDVTDRLERVTEPDERRVRAAERQNTHMHTRWRHQTRQPINGSAVAGTGSKCMTMACV